MCMQDVEEESVGKRNAATVRRGTGSKRSRAAEVHNLSERVSQYWSSFLFAFVTAVFSRSMSLMFLVCKQRRRDRINEKMRALQELVPNCNKVNNFFF